MEKSSRVHRCRRCEKEQPETSLRYIRMRVIHVKGAGRYVRETTSTPTEIGPYCPACLPDELNPA
jgi:hypothetical protein